MGMAEIAISLDKALLAKVDRLVKQKVFASRGQAVQAAVRDKLERIERGRLARECAKLEPHAERAMAVEGLAAEVREWPEY